MVGIIPCISSGCSDLMNLNIFVMKAIDILIQNYKNATEGFHILVKIIVAIVLAFIFIAVIFALVGVITGAL